MGWDDVLVYDFLGVEYVVVVGEDKEEDKDDDGVIDIV